MTNTRAFLFMLLENEPLIRMAAFAACLTACALLEVVAPRRKLRFDRRIRWPANLGMTLLNTLLMRVLFPLAAVGFATTLSTPGLLGLTGLTGLPGVIAAVILLDLAIYTQHVIFHRVPLLWRLHRMHHSDNDLDVTSGFRFHPLEMLLSMLIKLLVIWALGAPASAVLLFELLLSSGALFSHANIRLPGLLDTGLRLLIVTPDMHRVHHSVQPEETNSNFGFNLSVWDRLFGTYKQQPDAGHTGMTIGLAETQTINEQRIKQMLTLPFRD
jgi:sterol desaturase/sphingolipid hydroxylase (fatty acid hydroxylase superfamily)